MYYDCALLLTLTQVPTTHSLKVHYRNLPLSLALNAQGGLKGRQRCPRRTWGGTRAKVHSSGRHRSSEQRPPSAKTLSKMQRGPPAPGPLHAGRCPLPSQPRGNLHRGGRRGCLAPPGWAGRGGAERSGLGAPARRPSPPPPPRGPGQTPPSVPGPRCQCFTSSASCPRPVLKTDVSAVSRGERGAGAPGRAGKGGRGRSALGRAAWASRGHGPRAGRRRLTRSGT